MNTHLESSIERASSGGDHTTRLGGSEIADYVSHGENIGDTRGTTPTDSNTTPNVDEMRVNNSSSGSDT